MGGKNSCLPCGRQDIDDFTNARARPYLLDMKGQLIREIQTELKLAVDADKLSNVTSDKKTLAQVRNLKKGCEKKVKALYSSLQKVNVEIVQWDLKDALDSYKPAEDPTSETDLQLAIVMEEPVIDTVVQEIPSTSERTVEPISAVVIEALPDMDQDSPPGEHPAPINECENHEDEKPMDEIPCDLSPDDLCPVLLDLPPSLAEQDPQSVQPYQYQMTDFLRCAVLGKGGFGKVLYVQHKESNTYYAMKVLKKEVVGSTVAIERILTEKRIFLTVNPHPCIVDLFITFQTNNHLCFVMEFAPGGSLRTYIERDMVLDVPTAKFYIACVILGITYLHQKMIIHRDIKPDNILIDSKGYAKITDFGISKEGIGYTDRTNTFVGSLVYMAPEMINMEWYTRAIDWWAVGVTLYEMILGVRPFSGGSAITEDEAEFPPGMDEDLLLLISGLLRKNPEERLGSSIEDAYDLMDHEFFMGLDWNDLLQTDIQPPWIPYQENQEDLSNFDEEFTCLPPGLTPPHSRYWPMANEMEDAFRDFDY